MTEKVQAVVHIGSRYSSVNTNRAHLKYIFNPTIKLKPTAIHRLRLTNSKIPMTVRNLSLALGNHIMRYSVDSGVTYKVVTLDDGIYEVSNIDESIKFYVNQNADVEVDPITGANIYPFTIGSNASTSRAWITIDQNHSKARTTIVDLTNNSLYYV